MPLPCCLTPNLLLRPSESLSRCLYREALSKFLFPGPSAEWGIWESDGVAPGRSSHSLYSMGALPCGLLNTLPEAVGAVSSLFSLPPHSQPQLPCPRFSANTEPPITVCA